MIKDKYLGKYYKKYAYLFIFGILADILTDVAQIQIPKYLGEIVDIVSNNGTEISSIIRSVLIVAVCLFIGRSLWRFCVFGASSRTEAGLRHDMFLKAEKLSQRYYHENKVGTIMSWFSSDVEAIEEYIGWGLIMTVDALFLSTLSVYQMLRLDWVLALVAIIPMLALIVWGSVAEKSMSEKWDAKQKAYDNMYDFTQENFTGIRVIKAFVKEVQEMKAFAKVAKENSDKNLEFSKASILLDVSIEMIIGFVFVLILGLGSYFVYSFVTGNPVVLLGHIVDLSAAELTQFTGYVDILIWPMIAMGQVVQMRSRCKASLKRISDFLDEEEEIHNAEKPIVLENVKGKITFKHLTFNYPDSEIAYLHDISFEIKAGEMIGIVGKIGSGKTTLVNSLLRLYNINKDTILVDDIDIMDIDIKSLRDNIAYVPQDNFLFSDNIKNNIAFSNKQIDIDQVRNAAKFADVDENIIDFTEGYDTVTGERGVTLSGGQKQRISIARAYLKDAPIMIMDDSVSAVDMKTEETILNNIREKRKGKTTIIIASRVSTVSKLDRIIVLNDGHLEAFDKPSKLLKISPTYQKMVYLQKLESEL